MASIMAMKEYPLYTFKMILLGESGSGKTCLFHRIVYNHYRDGGTYENKNFSATPGSGGLTSLQYENHTKEVELSKNIRVNVCNDHTDARTMPIIITNQGFPQNEKYTTNKVLDGYIWCGKHAPLLYHSLGENLAIGNKFNTDFCVQVKVFDTGGGERANSMTQQYYRNAHIVCLVYSIDSDISFNALGKWVGDARFYLQESQHLPKMVFAMVGIKSDIPPGEREVKQEDVVRAAQYFNIPLDCCFEVSNITGDGVAHMMKQLAQKVFNLETRPSTQTATELHSYSSEHNQPHETNNAMTFKRWLCCCCCCCCKRTRDDYQPLV